MHVESLEPRALFSAGPTPFAHAVAKAAPAIVAQNSQGGVTIHPTAGVTFTGTVATFRLDSVPPPIVETDAQITWGDGGNSAGQIVQNPDQSYDVIGTHLYDRPGSYPIQVVITQGPRCPMPGGGPCPEFPTRIIQTIDSTAVVAPQPGDANGDGRVDFADLLILAQNYGKPGGWSAGDFNADGAVGFDDLLILAQNYR
jgi:hypothetical protein